MICFLHAGKRHSFLQVAATIFTGHGQACSDSQSNCRILRRAMSQKGLDRLL